MLAELLLVFVLLHRDAVVSCPESAPAVCCACRNKLTKLAGNKNERRKLSKEIQGLLQEEILGKPGSKQKKPVAGAAAAAAAETMAE
jgi:hypothetical protein